MGFKGLRDKTTGGGAGLQPGAKAAKVTTYIDQGCELSGNLRFSEPVQIDGHVDGDVRCQKALVIGESGSVHSSVACESIVVYGGLHGDVEAKHRITIHKSAHVTAQIRAGSVVIEEGASFKGQIQIGAQDDVKAAAETPSVQAAPRKPAPNADNAKEPNPIVRRGPDPRLSRGSAGS